MQASPNPDDERDLRTMVVADHGVDPSPVPRHKAPARQTAGMGLRDTLIWCGIPVLVILLLRVFVFGMYAIPSGSMENTIMPGDRVLTLSLAPKAVDLRRGDIVVFKDPANWLRNEQSNGVFGKDRLIKRLIGLPGDVVECAGEGSPVTINGVAINETSYIRPGVRASLPAASRSAWRSRRDMCSSWATTVPIPPIPGTIRTMRRTVWCRWRTSRAWRWPHTGRCSASACWTRITTCSPTCRAGSRSDCDPSGR